MSSDGQGFYITLPSESSKELFPENNPSEYTVRLPQWVHLNGHWEIGLHSIAYTSWNIIQYLDEPISFMEGGKEGKGGKMRKHYSSVKEYVDSINASLKESHIDKSPADKSNEIEFSYELNGKVTVRLSPGYTVRLRKEQAIVLGFMTFEDIDGLDIDRDDYPGGYALYAFDLTPDMCKSSLYFNTVQRGSLSLALTFSKATDHALAMVCYGDFENVIRIDSERNAIYDIS